MKFTEVSLADLDVAPLEWAPRREAHASPDPAPAQPVSALPAGAAGATVAHSPADQPAHPSAHDVRVNGVRLNRPDEALSPDEARQRACTELLRQAAQQHGLLDTQDAAGDDGVISEAAAQAIETLLERELCVPPPDETACLRHYSANAAHYRQGERALVRHILFAVTPGVDIRALRDRAERTLLELRAADAQTAFGQAAAQWSNCPSGAQGGELGWLQPQDCASEFAREVFGRNEIGVLPRLLHSRHGLHVVEVLAREPGTVPPFDAVSGAVRLQLQQQAYATALTQYLQLLAGRAVIEGVALDAASTPLVQ